MRDSSNMTQRRSTREHNRRTRHKDREQQESNLLKNEEGAIQRNMDEEQFASGMPGEHPSLSDKLDSHKAGTLFKYAVITNAPTEERSGMLSRLRSYRPPSRVENLALTDISPIRLIGETVNFPLSTAIGRDLLKEAHDFMLIDCVFVHFVPLDSFANDKSVVTIQINDFRKVRNTVSRVARIDNTMGYNVLFFLDYCVETRDANKITLSFSCPARDFQEGVSWGTVKVVAQIQFLSFPRRLPLIETSGVALLSDTDLDDFQCDPRELDLVLTPNAISRLRKAGQRGEIENLTLPRNDEVKMVTAKTILGENYDEDEVGSVIENMKKIAIARDKARMTAAKPPKPIIVNMSHEEDQGSGSGGEIEELNPSDSQSVTGKMQLEADEELQVAKGKKVIKFSN